MHRELPEFSEPLFRDTDVPRHQRQTSFARERAIGFGENALAWHRLRELPAFFAAEHRWPNTEPASQPDRPVEFRSSSREPVQDGKSCTGMSFQSIEDRGCSAARVQTEDAAAACGTFGKDAVQDASLESEAPYVFRGAIKTNFSDVARFPDQLTKSGDFRVPLVHELRMEAERDTNARKFRESGARACPCARCCSHRKDVDSLGACTSRDCFGIGVKIQVAMEIDHRAPTARRYASSSCSPRSATPTYGARSPS